MAEHILFLVQGMGEQTEGTFDSWKATLRTLYSRYSDGRSMDDQFRFVNINYNHLFEEQRSRWNDALDAILSAGAGQGLELPDRETLRTLTGDNFVGTHILDVLLYRFFPQMAENVRAEVVTQFGAALGETPGARFSVLAHSLGTAVAHDAIHALYHSHPTNPGNKLDPNLFHFDTIAMLANVSRILETDVDVYQSIVRPEKKGVGWKFACQKMLSASHKWDPLVAPKLFEPAADWPDPATRTEGLFTFARPTLIQDANPHAMEHYLRDPEVHIPLFRYLRYSSWISKAREAEERQAFLESNPLETFKDYVSDLKPLLVGEGDFSWKRFLQIFRAFYAAIKKHS